jgi:hypothetical protein
MTKSEQKKFVKSLSKSVIEGMIEKINKNQIPKEWDGFELRYWLACQFERENYMSRHTENRGRKNDCENDINVCNL